MIQVVLCDDDQEYLKIAESMIRSYTDEQGLKTEIQSFDTVEKLKNAIADGSCHPELIFLDIEFGEKSSLEDARDLNRMLPSCRIAFLTNYLSYATDVYEIDHFYYIIKDELPKRIGKVFQAFWGKDAEKRFSAPMGADTFVFRLGDICYVERQRRSCLVKTAQGIQKLTVSFEDFLKDKQEIFLVRCHHSFFVNLQYVSRYRKEEFELQDGNRIPISRFYQKSVAEQFRKWQEVWL